MKYTFEIMKEYEDAFKGISVYSVSEDKKLMVDFVAREELEDAQMQVDEAYHRGLEEGKKATWGLVADASSAEYQRGLDDAWEAAKKIASNDAGQNYAIFGQNFASVIFNTFTVSEAIEELKACEEQKADDGIDEKITGFLERNNYTVDEVFNRLKRMKGEE